MTYKETLDFLYTRLPMFHRVGAVAYKKDLTNTLALCEHLGSPQHRFRSIHVAGTNGKGSVTHFLAAAFQQDGYKTGLYTSPHYKDFRERIKINGVYMPRQCVIDFVECHRQLIESIEPSFFELCVAMAFDYFAQEKVDIAIIEVGLGGRLDSTNVITPLLSVVTNISYDHQNLLGDTLPEIAFEKAGIIKPRIPVIIGETHPESAPVFLEKARSVQAPITFADQKYSVVEKGINPSGSIIYEINDLENKGVVTAIETDLTGPYQLKNIATAYQTIQQLPADLRLSISKENGLKNPHILKTNIMGRWQMIGQEPRILCDSAHNEAGLKLAFERIQQMSFDRLHIVTGFVNDKDIGKGLALYPPLARYYFAKANIPRGLEATILKEKAASIGLEGRAYSSVPNALKAAKRAAKPNDLIVVIGSIFVIAEVL